MTDTFWWTVLAIAAAFELLVGFLLFLWWINLRADANMLRLSLSRCPVCQTNGDVMDFNRESVGDYCHNHFAHWMRIRERERRIAKHTDWEHDDEQV